MTNEFRTINGRCEGLVPRGPGYENVSISNQVCPTVGAVPGSEFVDGKMFTALSFEYDFSNTWRNFGIIIAYGVAFIGASLLFTEWNTRTHSNQGATLSKKNAKTSLKNGATPKNE
ncbi:hypothetical protein MPER_14294, partial [Moniliophthora perniciosa FA553]